MDTHKNIKNYLLIVNKKVEDIDKTNPGLIDFIIDETIDRVKLYLNSNKIPQVIERILARIVNTGLTKALKEIELANEDNTQTDHMISSISDNGQSISFSNEITKYFTTASDEELFTGFTSLLDRYRRITVVYPKSNDEND